MQFMKCLKIKEPVIEGVAHTEPHIYQHCLIEINFLQITLAYGYANKGQIIYSYTYETFV